MDLIYIPVDVLQKITNHKKGTLCKLYYDFTAEFQYSARKLIQVFNKVKGETDPLVLRVLRKHASFLGDEDRILRFSRSPADKTGFGYFYVE